MSDHESFEDQARSLMRDARRLEPAPPSFGGMWRRARQPNRRQRSLVPALGLALFLVLAMAWLGVRQRLAPDVEIGPLLASVADAPRAPLDFLLETPGDRFVRQLPRFGAVPGPIDLDAIPLPEE